MNVNVRNITEGCKKNNNPSAQEAAERLVVTWRRIVCLWMESLWGRLITLSYGFMCDNQELGKIPESFI